MPAIALHTDYQWPYDEALCWMDDARASVLTGGPMRLGVGAHVEEVISLGRHTPPTAIVDGERLRARGVIERRVSRGGGATVHSPGQLVCYPIVSLATLGVDIPTFTGLLESVILLTLEAVRITAVADPLDRGVYVDGAKIASIGFHCSRGVVTHGLALNVRNDLSLFSGIATCGQLERPMTSICQLGGAETVEIETVGRILSEAFAKVCKLSLVG